MGEENKVSIQFDRDTSELFCQMDEIREENNLDRLNSIILLKALLEEKDSIFYECLCETSTDNNSYKKIISECNQQLRNMSKKEATTTLSANNKFTIIIGEEERNFFLSDNFKNVIYNTYQFVLNEIQEEQLPEKIIIYPIDLFVGFIMDIPRNALTILKNNGVSIEAIKEYYSILEEIYNTNTVQDVENATNSNTLPKAISDFATILSAKYKGVKECEILGRDEECRKIMRTLQKRGKKNVILIGEPGVGKTAIAEKIAFDIANGNCPESLKDHIVIQVDVNSSIAGTMYRGMAEERFKVLIEYLNTHNNVILFIDEIHMVIGAGATSKDDTQNMANALKPFLSSKKAKVIGATTQKEFEKHFAIDEAFKRRFEKVIVKEPKSKDVYSMLEKTIKAHEEYHGVKIEKDMVEYAILISACFNKNTHNPDRTNDLIDSAMVIAKEKKKEYVDRQCILENFDINFEKFNNLEESKKISTAYHEAGHYIVWRKSGKLKNLKGIAISIMPAEDYLGVTVYDDISDEVTVYADECYYIDYLAKYIAGRVAEKVYTNSISSGARCDLEIANKLAYQIVTKFGMVEKYGNRAYFEDYEYHMMSEKIRNDIDKEVKSIIVKATKRAEEIISQNKELLKKLVDALLEKKILDENDLEEICKE